MVLESLVLDEEDRVEAAVDSSACSCSRLMRPGIADVVLSVSSSDEEYEGCVDDDWLLVSSLVGCMEILRES